MLMRLFSFFDKHSLQKIRSQHFIQINLVVDHAVIVKTYEKVSIKLAKYYVKIKDSDETIYNLANILNSTMKLNLYKT